MSVDPRLYHDTDPAEREAIAAELAELKLQWEAAAPVRDRYAARVAEIRRAPKGWQKAMMKRLELEFAGLQRVLRQGEIPVRLMACADCGRPTSSCVCVGRDGRPLDWRQ